MERMDTPIREVVLDWITANPRQDFTTNKVAVECKLDRNQAKRALHALKDHINLENTGSGTWRYTPARGAVAIPQAREAHDVPIGWAFTGVVTARIDDWYIAEATNTMSPNEPIFLWVKPMRSGISWNTETSDSATQTRSA